MLRARLAFAFVAAALVAGCGGPLTGGGVTILRYGPMPGGMSALAEGTLRYIDGCAVVENVDANGARNGRVVLWPAGTDLQSIDGRVHVVLGGVAATDGDEVSLSGGEQTDQAWVEELVGPVGACRSDVYWMALTMERR
jgi:hypothetical protein